MIFFFFLVTFALHIHFYSPYPWSLAIDFSVWTRSSYPFSWSRCCFGLLRRVFKTSRVSLCRSRPVFVPEALVLSWRVEDVFFTVMGCHRVWCASVFWRSDDSV